MAVIKAPMSSQKAGETVGYSIASIMQVSVLPIEQDAEILHMKSLEIHLSRFFRNYDTLLVQKAILGLSGLSRQESLYL